MSKMLIGFRIITVSVVALTVSVASAQVVPGYSVSDYAYVDRPLALSFDPTGVLYAGHGTPGLNPGKPWRIEAGGSPVAEYGDTYLSDPDAVRYDELGTVSGVPGSLLVTGMTEFSVKSSLWAIHPDETVSTIFADETLLPNPNVLLFDSTDRLLILENNNGGVFSYVGSTLTQLYSIGQPTGSLALDSADNLYTGALDGIIRVHAPDGTLIDNNFADLGSASDAPPMTRGPGGALWGDDLYAVSRATGELLRIDSLGTITPIGTGFNGVDRVGDLEFGPDGALYVSFVDTSRIVRIIPEPTTLTLIALASLALWRRRV